MPAVMLLCNNGCTLIMLHVIFTNTAICHFCICKTMGNDSKQLGVTRLFLLLHITTHGQWQDTGLVRIAMTLISQLEHLYVMGHTLDTRVCVVLGKGFD